ncbi:MAG: hypothetical protein KDJ90_06720 [Nitratireductor sp.]|nr:hypothetical protein [Nitratireductor sp.]
MPDIDRAAFAAAIRDRLLALGRAEGRDTPLPYQEAQARFTGISAGSLSRAASQITVSAAVTLAICKALSLDPFDYLDLEAEHPHSTFGLPHREKKSQSNQGVSVPVKRETSPWASLSQGCEGSAGAHHHRKETSS